MDYTQRNLILFLSSRYYYNRVHRDNRAHRIAFPGQIKSSIEKMGPPEINVTPIVNVDPCYLGQNAGDLQNFVRNQIERRFWASTK